MGIEVNIEPDMLTWAVARAGFDLNEFSEKFPNLTKWINGEKNPTVKQLEAFSKKVHIPFGYLFLAEPPIENLPIPFFRTNAPESDQINLNIYDTVLLMEQRQDWLSNYLQENNFDKLDFVGKYEDVLDERTIVDDIRKTLNLSETWASNYGTWEESLNKLVEHIEDCGIIVVFNGIVENNVYRKIPVEECRGFILIDDYAPFMFINNGDSKAAQMFTIVHELAHVWVGASAGFDIGKLLPADDPIEILCDKVAAEFLVPERAFNLFWQHNPVIKSASKYFKVSEIVIARRALDTNKISKAEFFEFYNEYKNREYVKNENRKSGGNFYLTTKKRLSPTFAAHINNAVNTGQLLYRDAYKLTSLKGDTFKTFFTEHL